MTNTFTVSNESIIFVSHLAIQKTVSQEGNFLIILNKDILSYSILLDILHVLLPLKKENTPEYMK